MEKGIKLMGRSGKGESKRFVKSKKNIFVVKGDQDIGFEIFSWHKDTTEVEKQQPITWSLKDSNRNSISSKQKKSSDEFIIKIPKALCGTYAYYLEANWASGKFKNKDEAIIIGFTVPKIVTSKWSATPDGEDQRKNYFKYGHLVYLGLETEGLNGEKNLSVEVYKVVQAGHGADDDQLIHTFTNVQVIDGEVNLKIGNTAMWFGHARNDIEKFYVKVKHRGQYITDGKDTIHARFLRIKREIVSTAIEAPKNLTPTKVGKVEVNLKSGKICKYTKIEADDKIYFDETEINKQGKVSTREFLHFIKNKVNKDKITVTITAKNNLLCKNHNKLYDISQMEKGGFKDVKAINNNSFSFSPRFGYKHTNDPWEFAKAYFLVTSAMAAIVPVHSCGYNHNLSIKVYPDVAFAYHLALWNPEKPKYFREVPITLVKGLDKELEELRKLLHKVAEHNYTSLPFVTKFIYDLGVDFLKDLANECEFGLHAYYDFDFNNKNPKIIDYTAKYPWIARTVIIAYVVVAIVITAIILYLTRGRAGAASRLGKSVKVAQKIQSTGKKLLNKAGLEALAPKIIVQRAKYYDYREGVVNLVFEENVQALPLFGIKYETDYTLGDGIMDFTGINKVFDLANKTISIVGKILKWDKRLKKIFGDDYRDSNRNSSNSSHNNTNNTDNTPSRQNSNGTNQNDKHSYVGLSDASNIVEWLQKKTEENINAIMEELGQKLNFQITVSGEYRANYSVKFNITTEEFTLEEKIEEYKMKGITGLLQDHTTVAFGNNKGVDIKAECELQTGYSINTEYMLAYIPDFIGKNIPQHQSSASLSGKAEIHGSYFYERAYYLDKKNKRAFYVDTTIFTGVAGTIKGSAMNETTERDGKKRKKEAEFSKSFVIMKPYIVKGEKVPLFEDVFK
ncbi:MAG: hypothetical protein QM535_05155 [Limnohabitans sp.]|nr:hypothetical protein [Limnohabitans sp.]